MHNAEAVLGRERLEGHLGRIRPVDPGRLIPGTVRAEEQDAGAGQAFHQRTETFFRTFIDPVKVLYREDDRPAPAALDTHLPKSLDGPRLDRLWGQRGQRFYPLLHSQELEEIRGPLVRIHPHLMEEEADLFGDGLCGIDLGDPVIASEHVEYGEIGNGAPVREAAAH